MRKFPLLSLVGVVSACSQALVIERPRTVVADNAGLVCKKSTPIGTIRAHRVCTTSAERAEHEQAAEAGMDQEKQDRLAEEIRRTFHRGE